MRQQRSWIEMKTDGPAIRFVLCIQGGETDLEQRKLYQVVPDRSAERDGYLRIIDESGEDYLYPAEYFVGVRLPSAVTQQLRSA